MPKLTDLQMVLLSSAAQRDDGALLPLPKRVKLEPRARTRVFNALLKKELVSEQPAPPDAPAWRETGDGQRFMLVINPAGLEAIGVEPEGEREEPEKSEKAKPSPKRRKKRKDAGDGNRAGRAPRDQARPDDRDAEPRRRRDDRRDRRGDRLAAALGARRDQRHAQEEARARPSPPRTRKTAGACIASSGLGDRHVERQVRQPVPAQTAAQLRGSAARPSTPQSPGRCARGRRARTVVRCRIDRRRKPDGRHRERAPMSRQRSTRLEVVGARRSRPISTAWSRNSSRRRAACWRTGGGHFTAASRRRAWAGGS